MEKQLDQEQRSQQDLEILKRNDIVAPAEATSEIEGEETNQNLNQINQSFLEMKKELQSTTDFTKIAQIGGKYFSQELIDKINTLTAQAATKEEKWRLFNQEVILKGSNYQDIKTVDVNQDDERKEAKLTIKTKSGDWETVMIYENNNWLYTGEEKRVTIVGENGQFYKVVTEETAEYDITIDEETGAEKHQMKEGQIILDDKIIITEEKSTR